MAKIAVLDDYEAAGVLIQAPLQREGHDVRLFLATVDFEALMDFGPDLIVLTMYRKQEAFNRPIRSLDEDVLGALPLRQMEAYPAINVIPILIIGTGLEEHDIPTHLKYDLFLSFPGHINVYFDRIREMACNPTPKSRRTISGYVCPHCGSRMTFTTREQELFCPRCHTTVSLIDGQDCLMVVESHGECVPCALSQLMPPAR